MVTILTMRCNISREKMQESMGSKVFPIPYAICLLYTSDAADECVNV